MLLLIDLLSQIRTETRICVLKLENVCTTLCPNHMPVIKGIINVTAGLKPANLSQKVITCMLSQEPFAGTLPNLHLYIFEAGSMAD